MKTITFTNRDDWMEQRKGKITGTRLKNIIVKRGKKKKIGFYELIAERLFIDDYLAEELSPMERGTMLEKEAIDMFRKREKKEVDDSLVLWCRDDNDNIAISPDGVISETEAVEVKCLSSSRHIEAIITDAIPSDYEMQAIQYFVVNEKLETLYFVFYDPRIPVKPFFMVTVKRESVADQVTEYLEYQKAELDEVDQWVKKLSAGTEFEF